MSGNRSRHCLRVKVDIAFQRWDAWPPKNTETLEENMTESIYKIVELVGTSPESWEEAAKNAVNTAGKTLKDLRIAEIVQMDMKVEENRVVAYRARVKLSFKFQEG
jgi:flavin-binding protein dodecin